MSQDQSILDLSARETARRVNTGTLEPEAVARAFIGRIETRDGEVQAFQHFDPASVIAEARRVDRAAPLAGVTVGVKDVIDTADMPTGYGSAAYDGFRPAWDAPAVVLTRRAGGIVLGKTVSTEFAMMSPGKTRNPHGPDRTPGGSSSGSCAAVAAGMAHIAFGTQTAGSIVRPASYCGVVGYKPSFGTLNRTGIKVLADSLDTLGIIARDVRDAAFASAVLAEHPELAVPKTVAKPRIGLFRTSRWNETESATRDALDRARIALEAKGVLVEDRAVPDWFDDLFAAHDTVMGYETPRSLAHEHGPLRDRITETTRTFLDTLSKTTPADYRAVRTLLSDRTDRLDSILGECDAVLTPAAPGEAPEGLHATGSPLFNKVWTLLHGPCLSVPAGRGPAGLPVGVQLVARLNDDARLLAAAAFVEDALAEQEV
jgi:amidase